MKNIIMNPYLYPGCDGSPRFFNMDSAFSYEDGCWGSCDDCCDQGCGNSCGGCQNCGCGNSCGCQGWGHPCGCGCRCAKSLKLCQQGCGQTSQLSYCPSLSVCGRSAVYWGFCMRKGCGGTVRLRVDFYDCCGQLLTTIRRNVTPFLSCNPRRMIGRFPVPEEACCAKLSLEAEGCVNELVVSHPMAYVCG